MDSALGGTSDGRIKRSISSLREQIEAELSECANALSMTDSRLCIALSKEAKASMRDCIKEKLKGQNKAKASLGKIASKIESSKAAPSMADDLLKYQQRRHRQQRALNFFSSFR